MSKQAAELVFNGNTTPYTAYDSAKVNLGQLLFQYTGVGASDNFVGPMQIGMTRPMEAATAIALTMPHPISVTPTLDWVFLVENSTASPTRRVVLYEFDRTTSTFTWKGYVTLTYPAATNHPVRGFRMTRDLYTTGTTAVSGTAVTGTGTAWKTARYAVGARIGFGSTDPAAISTWSEITAMASDTSITIADNLGTISAGTPFVIEELRAITTTTNATATNGGVFVTKGLNYKAFALAGTTVPAATTVDNIRAVYWLADASTLTNTAAAGCAIEPKASETSHNIYVLDGAATNSKAYKYNVRAALTLTAGKDTTALVLATGTAVLSGNQTQNNNGRAGTLNHGPGNGIASLYWVTSTRVYRAALSSITSGSTTWPVDAMLEVPPGSTATFAASGSLSQLDLAEQIDRLIILAAGASGQRCYVTQYNTSSTPFDHIMMVDTKQNDQSTADLQSTPMPSVSGTSFSVWAIGGVAYLCRNSAVATLNQLYAVPLGAHWTYAAGSSSATQQRVITPIMATPGAVKYYRAYVNDAKLYGGSELGMSPETWRLSYRTAGMVDNSGSWTALDDTHDLTGVSASSSIQFMFEFRCISPTLIPNRIFSMSVVYDADDSLPAELRWNLGDSDNTNGTVGISQTATFGTLPTLTITYRRADTDAVVLTQSSASTTNGKFQYWSGSAWTDGLGSNSTSTRRRFVPTAGLPAGIDTYAKIVAS